MLAGTSPRGTIWPLIRTFCGSAVGKTFIRNGLKKFTTFYKRHVRRAKVKNVILPIRYFVIAVRYMNGAVIPFVGCIICNIVSIIWSFNYFGQTINGSCKSLILKRNCRNKISQHKNLTTIRFNDNVQRSVTAATGVDMKAQRHISSTFISF